MENHGLGTHNDKICAHSSTENTPSIPQFIRPKSPNRPIIYDIFEKSSHHMPIVHASKQAVTVSFRGLVLCTRCIEMDHISYALLQNSIFVLRRGLLNQYVF